MIYVKQSLVQLGTTSHLLKITVFVLLLSGHLGSSYCKEKNSFLCQALKVHQGTKTQRHAYKDKQSTGLHYINSIKAICWIDGVLPILAHVMLYTYKYMLYSTHKENKLWERHSAKYMGIGTCFGVNTVISRFPDLIPFKKKHKYGKLNFHKMHWINKNVIEQFHLVKKKIKYSSYSPIMLNIKTDILFQL